MDELAVALFLLGAPILMGVAILSLKDRAVRFARGTAPALQEVPALAKREARSFVVANRGSIPVRVLAYSDDAWLTVTPTHLSLEPGRGKPVEVAVAPAPRAREALGKVVLRTDEGFYAEIWIAPDTNTSGDSGEAARCGVCAAPAGSGRSLYGLPVCNSCYTGFANRRQLAFMIDLIGYFGVEAIFLTGLAQTLHAAIPQAEDLLLDAAKWGASPVVFALRDGFSGRSPGKALLGLAVLKAGTGEPAGFKASLLRNLSVAFPLLNFLLIPIEGYLMQFGARLGDRLAGTRVVWLRYRNSPAFHTGPDPRQVPRAPGERPTR